MSEDSRPSSILLVEDDPALALGLTDALEFEGYRVLSAKTGAEAVKLAARERPNCILLDIMLPDVNGYQVCEEIRRVDALVPIIMLTARSQETDKIRGLDAGADDYVTKPFSIGELVARIRAMFRRMTKPAAACAREPFTIGSCEIDPIAQTLVRGKTTDTLSFYEVGLLQLLHERAGQAVTRDEILERIWGVAASHSNRSVDNFVVKLRRKVEESPDKPRHILTIYGVGYKLVV